MNRKACPWFYHPDLDAPGSTVHLSGDEAQHARGARRLSVGDEVSFFDGAGCVAQARVDSLGTRHAGLGATLLSVERTAPVQPILTVASAIPKGDRLSTLLSMLAQLSIHQFVPLQCTRSVAEGGQRLGKRGERIILEACKQARCAHAMRIAAPQTLASMLEGVGQRDAQALLADPAGGSLRALPEPGANGDVILLIGPEGGFTDDERDACRVVGVEEVSLGQTILRIETACVALASAIRLWTTRA